MKAKKILEIRDRLSQLTDEKKFHEEGNNELTYRFDAYDEMIYIAEQQSDKCPEIRLSIEEAKRLKNLLNKLF